MIATIAGASFFGCLNIALVIFFRTKEFDEEHRADNQKVVSSLIAEFKTTVDQWIARRATITDEARLTELLPELVKLAKIGAMVEKWNKHITSGKDMLHKAAGAILAGGTFFSLGLAAFVEEDPSYYQVAAIPIFLGFVGALYAARFMTDYLSLKREIAQRCDDLRLGRPVVRDSQQ